MGYLFDQITRLFSKKIVVLKLFKSMHFEIQSFQIGKKKKNMKNKKRPRGAISAQ
jgi:hypothetical protein